MDNTFDTHFISFNVFDVLLQRFDLFGVCFGQQRQLMDVIAVISMGTVLQKRNPKKKNESTHVRMNTCEHTNTYQGFDLFPLHRGGSFQCAVGPSSLLCHGVPDLRYGVPPPSTTQRGASRPLFGTMEKSVVGYFGQRTGVPQHVFNKTREHSQEVVVEEEEEGERRCRCQSLPAIASRNNGAAKNTHE